MFFEPLELRRLLSGMLQEGLLNDAPVPQGTAECIQLRTHAQSGVCVEVAGPLSAAETQDLLAVTREEKLARDVYNAMYALWDKPVFRNIALAEQQHFDAASRLLTRYGVENPVAGRPAGVFDDPAVQATYDQYVAAGSQSLLEAMRVGVEIETADMAMLRSAIQTSTHADVKLVYRNLLSASQSHLRTFRSHVNRLTDVL